MSSPFLNCSISSSNSKVTHNKKWFWYCESSLLFCAIIHSNAHLFLFICAILCSLVNPNVATPKLNREIKIHKIISEADVNQNVTFLKTDPLDVHVNVGDVAKFDVFLT